jgi:hypothetical protein
VKLQSGQELHVSINPYSTIEKLKRAVASAVRIATYQQRIIFEGIVLEDKATLSDYPIQSGDTVHVVIRLRGGGTSFANITESGNMFNGIIFLFVI